MLAGSLVLQEARERHIAGGKFCDLPMGGVYVIRGENLTLLGEIVRHDVVSAAHRPPLRFPLPLTLVCSVLAPRRVPA